MKQQGAQRAVEDEVRMAWLAVEKPGHPTGLSAAAVATALLAPRRDGEAYQVVARLV